MYIAFCEHNILPSQYFNALPSEKRVIRAFLSQEYEEHKKQQEELERSMHK